jgi:hypothetical protein
MLGACTMSHRIATIVGRLRFSPTVFLDDHQECAGGYPGVDVIIAIVRQVDSGIVDVSWGLPFQTARSTQGFER